MLRVALDLGRTPHVAFDENTGAVPVPGDGGGVEHRLAVRRFEGTIAVRHDLLERRMAAAGGGECERSAHELQEVAAIEPGRPEMHGADRRHRPRVLGKAAPITDGQRMEIGFAIG